MERNIQLFGAIAVRPAVLPLLAEFETKSGFHVSPRWELNPEVKKQIDAGAVFDIVITNPEPVEAFIASGKVKPRTNAAFGRVAMGVAARSGSPPREVGSVESFRQALRDAGSVAYASEGTSGAYFRALLRRLQLPDVEPKLVGISGGQTATAVGRGEAEIGVVPVTSIIAAEPAVTLVGKFPAELQSFIDFAIGIGTLGRNPEGASQLSEFLMAPELDARLAAKGLDRYPDEH